MGDAGLFSLRQDWLNEDDSNDGGHVGQPEICRFFEILGWKDFSGEAQFAGMLDRLPF